MHNYLLVCSDSLGCQIAVAEKRLPGNLPILVHWRLRYKGSIQMGMRHTLVSQLHLWLILGACLLIEFTCCIHTEHISDASRLCLRCILITFCTCLRHIWTFPSTQAVVGNSPAPYPFEVKSWLRFCKVCSYFAGKIYELSRKRLHHSLLVIKRILLTEEQEVTFG